jgi:hypothetical protein
MHRTPVESSQIASIGYDPGLRKLEIEFPPRSGYPGPGAVYEYENVPQDVYDGFFAVDPETKQPRSIGRYFGQTIKSNPQKYPYRKVQDRKPKGE